jgi:CHAT domain
MLQNLRAAVGRACSSDLAAHREDLVQAALLRVLEHEQRGEQNQVRTASYLWRVAFSVIADDVVDVEAPERSAVVLASGTEREDGLLQSREISALELDRAVVVLAACRSASGLGLRGEGVVGLARSFFEAGAHGVVGSLWPLRDDESSVLLEGFYRGLARGSSVAEAMAGARRERIGAGAATAAWAGMVVLGDGEIRPLAAGPDPGRRRAVAILVLATSALLALVGGLRLRERRGSGSP